MDHDDAGSEPAAAEEERLRALNLDLAQELCEAAITIRDQQAEIGKLRSALGHIAQLGNDISRRIAVDAIAPSAPANVGDPPPLTAEQRARLAYQTIEAFGWQIQWRHEKQVPDDAWPIDIISKAITDHARDANVGGQPEAGKIGKWGAWCFDCGRPYGDEHGFPDLVIENWAWTRIAPIEGNGLLCPSCICKRLHDRGIECEGRFKSGPLSPSPSVMAANPWPPPAPAEDAGAAIMPSVWDHPFVNDDPYKAERERREAEDAGAEPCHFIGGNDGMFCTTHKDDYPCRVEVCPGDNAPCYAGDGDDAHWRCGTTQCPHQETLRSKRAAEDAGAVTNDESFQCPACHWHQGHDPDEWFAAEVRIRNRRAEDAGAGGDARCADCRRPYGDEHGFPDLVISHDAWAKITHDRDGLLCPSCLCARAHGAGLSNVPAIFTSGPFCAPNTDALDDLVNNPPPPSAALTRLLRDPPPWDSAPSADANALERAEAVWRDIQASWPNKSAIDTIAAALTTHGRAAAERMRGEFLDCARYDATMEGPKFRGWNRSALDRLREKYEAQQRALPLDPEQTP